MFRIGEFAVLSSISIHMLRNYDKLGLLSPEYTDEWTGYRYYSEAQIITANRIQALKAMGLGLKEIAQILRDDTFGESYKKLLEEKLEEKKNEIKKKQEEIIQLQLSLKKAEEKEHYICDVAVKELPKRTVISYRSRIHQFSEEGRLWGYLSQFCERNHIKQIQHGFAAAISHEINREKHYSDVETVFEVETVGADREGVTFYEMPACQVASIAYRGKYYEIANINYHLGRWTAENHYELCGHPFSIYYISPGNETDESKYLTEICFPIKKKN